MPYYSRGSRRHQYARKTRPYRKYVSSYSRSKRKSYGYSSAKGAKFASKKKFNKTQYPGGNSILASDISGPSEYNAVWTNECSSVGQIANAGALLAQYNNYRITYALGTFVNNDDILVWKKDWKHVCILEIVVWYKVIDKLIVATGTAGGGAGYILAAETPKNVGQIIGYWDVGNKEEDATNWPPKFLDQWREMPNVKMISEIPVHFRWTCPSANRDHYSEVSTFFAEANLTNSLKTVILAYSGLSVEQCPLSMYLNWVDRLKPDTVGTGSPIPMYTNESFIKINLICKMKLKFTGSLKYMKDNSAFTHKIVDLDCSIPCSSDFDFEQINMR